MPHMPAPGNLLLQWSALEGLRLPMDYRSRRVTRLIPVGPGATVTLCDIKGAGCINHIWITLGENNYRNIILRAYWDDEEDPSVEAPVTELFGIGHNQRYVPLASPLLCVSPHNGLNIYFPMPFSRRARLTLTNDNFRSVDGAVYFQADYSEYADIPECPLRFHAQWRRDNPAPRRGHFYTLAEAVGSGYLAGVALHLRLRDHADAWYHGGGDEILIDGGSATADVIHGIGGEDFFGASWGIAPFQSPYASCVVEGDCLSMHRFFLESPIKFRHNLRASFGAMANDISSVAYWYQTEPHHRFFRLPPPDLRQPESDLVASDYDVRLLADLQPTWAVLGPFAGGVGAEYEPERVIAREEEFDLSAPVPTDHPGPFGAVEPPPPGQRTVHWQRLRADLWWVDLNAVFMPKYPGPTCVQTVHGCAYLLGRVESNRDWRAALQITFDDDLKVWLDEHLIFTGSHPDNPRTVLIPVELRRGSNTILVKTTNAPNENWSAWCLSLRVCQKDGTPTDVVSFDALPDLPEAPLLLRFPPTQ